jgi:hypothetical protein
MTGAIATPSALAPMILRAAWLPIGMNVPAWASRHMRSYGSLREKLAPPSTSTRRRSTRVALLLATYFTSAQRAMPSCTPTSNRRREVTSWACR